MALDIILWAHCTDICIAAIALVNLGCRSSSQHGNGLLQGYVVALKPMISYLQEGRMTCVRLCNGHGAFA